jgi:2,3-bisphosphoglycerate-independent phosphoglycerate mutase
LEHNKAGNSEVGHLNIGSGRIVKQYSVLIHNDIDNGSFFKNEVLNKSLTDNKGNIHIMGLLSDSAVHSSLYSLKALIKAINKKGIYLHIFSDGRDSYYMSIKKYLKELDNYIKDGTIIPASIIGRYYAMDRDNRQERVQKAFNLLFEHKGESVNNIDEAIEISYKNKIYDEFIDPYFVKDTPIIEDQDLLFFFNFREDRARELSLLIQKKSKVSLICMVQYTDDIKKYLYKRLHITNTLGKILSENNISQYRVAESEKYAHVTYFFDGGTDIEYPNEKRDIIPSLKIATYDLEPQMQARKITAKILENIENTNFIVANFANPDMVGHTGNFEKTKEAIEIIDTLIGEIGKKCINYNSTLIITGDHGNAEQMISNGNIDKSHTTNEVPFILYNNSTIDNRKKIEPGKLADIAPTILKLFNIQKPIEMTGESLI